MATRLSITRNEPGKFLFVIAELLIRTFPDQKEQTCHSDKDSKRGEG
jgi:hypothetical protein